MKKLTFILFFMTSALYIGAQNKVLHLNLGSHNEMSDPSYGVNYNSKYLQIKQKALAVADSVNANNARWNMQVESNFIRACIQFDNANSTSTDLMETLDKLEYVEVDPHNHLDTISKGNPNYNPYNYADLNHLLDSCGLSVRTNVGGFIYNAKDWETWDADWTKWKDGLKGRTFPNTTWTPVVLWGGGTLNHVNDPQPSGIWHPGGPTTSAFLTNNPSQLMDIGNGCKFLIKDTTNAANLIKELNDYLTKLNSIPVNSNTFYTATIMFDFRYILDAGYVEKIAEVLRGIQPFVKNGSVVWQTLTEKRSEWLENHNNTTDFFLMECSDIETNITNISEKINNPEIVPNPAENGFILENTETNSKISIYNVSGKLILSQNIDEQNKFINIDNFETGIYFVKIFNEKSIITKKLIKQ